MSHHNDSPHDNSFEEYSPQRPKTQLDVDKKRVIDKVQKSVKNVAIIVKNRYFQNMEGKDRTFGAKIAKKIDYNCKSTNIVTRQGKNLNIVVIETNF